MGWDWSGKKGSTRSLIVVARLSIKVVLHQQLPRPFVTPGAGGSPPMFREGHLNTFPELFRGETLTAEQAAYLNETFTRDSDVGIGSDYIEQYLNLQEKAKNKSRGCLSKDRGIQDPSCGCKVTRS